MIIGAAMRRAAFSSRTSTAWPSQQLRSRGFAEGSKQESRRALRQKITSSSKISYGWLAFGSVAAGAGVFTFLITGDSEAGKSIRDSFWWRWLVLQINTVAKPFTEPNREKLLPDWPFIPNTPPDAPCPPTLVLDLEGTLCTSTWDPKYGMLTRFNFYLSATYYYF